MKIKNDFELQKVFVFLLGFPGSVATLIRKGKNKPPLVAKK